MNGEWTALELQAATRTYLWLLRSQKAGYTLNKTKVREALLAGPLSARNESSVESMFQNLSAVMDGMEKDWVSGYRPAKNVGQGVTPLIESAIDEYENGEKHTKRVSWLVSALPAEMVAKAAKALSAGAEFNFNDSTTYDVALESGETLAPKAVIGYAALLYYGAPLLAVDFVGGLGTPGFERLRAAGFVVGMKAAPDSDEFRKAVKKAKRKKFTEPPSGRMNPPKNQCTATAFSRLPEVVAYVEERAQGICEKCDKPAPFLRNDGTPYLEVHHIEPLSEDGADTVENSAGICPNCHRECHSGQDAVKIRSVLKGKIARRQAAFESI